MESVWDADGSLSLHTTNLGGGSRGMGNHRIYSTWIYNGKKWHIYSLYIYRHPHIHVFAGRHIKTMDILGRCNESNNFTEDIDMTHTHTHTWRWGETNANKTEMELKNASHLKWAKCRSWQRCIIKLRWWWWQNDRNFTDKRNIISHTQTLA